MSEIRDPRFSERLLETAARWVVLIGERPLTADEQQAFRTWVLETEAHRLAFEEVAATRGRVDILRGLSDLFPAVAASDTAESAARMGTLEPRPIRSRWIAYLGAGLIAASVLTLLHFVDRLPTVQPREPGAERAYLTRVGEIETIDLDDGSRIVVNTDSRLRVGYLATERRVLLDQGEAFFEVERDPNRDFNVVAGDIAVRAVGTAFSVHRDGDATRVLVAEGVVEITRINAPTGNRPAANALDQPLSLQAGQIAEFGPAEPKIDTIGAAEIARRLLWRQGVLAFAGEPLEQVIAEFSRYTTVDIQIEDDALRDIRIGGYFDSRDLAGMLTALQTNFGVEVSYPDSDRVLLKASD